jgi:hypothetical protein
MVIFHPTKAAFDTQACTDSARDQNMPLNRYELA